VAAAFQAVVGEERKAKVVIRPCDPEQSGRVSFAGEALRWQPLGDGTLVHPRL
jgi:hypothetical protein